MNLNVNYNTFGRPTISHFIFSTGKETIPAEIKPIQEEKGMGEEIMQEEMPGVGRKIIYSPELGEYLMELKIGKSGLVQKVMAILDTGSKDISLISHECHITPVKVMTNGIDSCQYLVKKYGGFNHEKSKSCISVNKKSNCSNIHKNPVIARYGSETIKEIRFYDYLHLTGRYELMKSALEISLKTQTAGLVPSIVGLSPNNTSGIRYIKFDFPVMRINFHRTERPKYQLMPVSNAHSLGINFYMAKVNNISWHNNSFYSATTGIMAMMDTGTNEILLPSQIYNRIKIYLSRQLGIAMDDAFWRGRFIYLSSKVRMRLKGMGPLIISFQTHNGQLWHCQIPRMSVFKEKNGQHAFLIDASTPPFNNIIVFGNSGMKNYKISFSTDTGTNLVSVY